MMKKIYYIFFERGGEIDAFFGEDDKLITYWFGNDANWRDEYMSGLLAHCGFETVTPTAKQRKKFEKLLISELKGIGSWDDEGGE
jgi:hypothetical protein